MKTVTHMDDQFKRCWHRSFEESEYQSPLYQHENLNYYRTLSSGRGAQSMEERSFLIMESDDILAAIKMTLVQSADQKKELSTYAMLPIWYHENRKLTAKKKKKVGSEIKSQLKRIVDKENISRIWYEDPLLDRNISYFSKMLLSMGAKATAGIKQVIDLGEDEASLFQNVRKSYKSLINWGRRNLDLNVYHSENVTSDLIEQFRLLHIQVAGRETRSKKSWMIQEKMIRDGEAFAVFGELEGKLVTAALFPISPTYCFYGVSASIREMFDKPLSHSVVWTAVMHAAKQGCRIFELGPIQFPGMGDTPPSEKELSISQFKLGFGGRSETRLSVIWQQATEPSAPLEREC